jgi:hypothetical protein
MATVLGFGETESGNSSDVLLYTKVPIVSEEEVCNCFPIALSHHITLF